jgi:hypothetical protein
LLSFVDAEVQVSSMTFVDDLESLILLAREDEKSIADIPALEIADLHRSTEDS